jgi:hypothetical protein
VNLEQDVRYMETVRFKVSKITVLRSFCLIVGPIDHLPTPYADDDDIHVLICFYGAKNVEYTQLIEEFSHFFFF